MGIHLPSAAASRQAFEPLRRAGVEPFALERAIAAARVVEALRGRVHVHHDRLCGGLRPAFCEPGCARTAAESFVRRRRLASRRYGWLVARDAAAGGRSRARAGGDRARHRGRRDSAARDRLSRSNPGSPRATCAPPATTMSRAPWVRGSGSLELTAPVSGEVRDALGYFTGAARVEELSRDPLSSRGAWPII